MSLEKGYSVETREAVVKSMVNSSTSKQLWSFSKNRRFKPIKSECPHAFYQTKTSTISNKKVRFTSSVRRVFTQTSDAPLPGTYATNDEKSKNVPFFAQSREKCKVHSYLPIASFANPGPSQYGAEFDSNKSGKGYTMRPKTANNRNYFVDDKEKQAVPSPFTYDTQIETKGNGGNSKFKSTGLGGAGLMKRQTRFLRMNPQTPSCWVYTPLTENLKSKSIGGQIGTAIRQSFIDKIRHMTDCPGPGDYDLPSQFGHYKKAESNKHLITE